MKGGVRERKWSRRSRTFGRTKEEGRKRKQKGIRGDNESEKEEENRITEESKEGKKKNIKRESKQRGEEEGIRRKEGR